jgi:ABC transporter substrate binding protein (PQQ-dependent alcohol dehydrogenase system)
MAALAGCAAGHWAEQLAANTKKAPNRANTLERRGLSRQLEGARATGRSTVSGLRTPRTLFRPTNPAFSRAVWQLALVTGILMLLSPVVLAQAPELQAVHVGLLARKTALPPTFSFNAVPVDQGFAGARAAIKDNDTTGRFTGQRYVLVEVMLDEDDSPVTAVEKLVQDGTNLIAVNLPAEEVVAVADALRGRNAILFNIGAPDDALRGAECRGNVFHIAPSRAMLTDALAQFLAFKRWRKLFLVVGPKPADKAYADAMKRAARKFGLAIAAEKSWDFGPLAQTKGDSPTTADALVFTRGIDYDVVVVADESGEFGDYIPYRTWDPRPVAGTQALVPSSWHATHEYWGAAQLQNRFRRAAERTMRPIDYQAWVAVRAIGEAVTRLRRSDPGEIGRFMLGPDFNLAAFKGVPLSFRPWDHQLRQPILIAQPAALVSVAPEAGFLHQRTPLDTLGVDQPESTCRFP